jgi:hypothetical protein
MGASAWSYFVPYQPDPFSALEALRRKVFLEGDYLKSSPVLLDFEAFNDGLLNSGSRSTHSIIDIHHRDRLHELSSEAVKQQFGTNKPTRDDVTSVDVIASAVGRNHCTYFTVYSEGEPSEIFFFGFSGD